MGNKTSTSTNLTKEVDRIASKYIVSQNFNDINKMSEKDHCDKLMLLTAKLINQKLNPLEQKEVLNRIKPNSNEDEQNGMAKEDISDANMGRANMGRANMGRANLGRANISDANISDANLGRANISDANLGRYDRDYGRRGRRGMYLNSLDDEDDFIGGAEPPPDCIKIAKFYVRIAHIYAAIVKTINPVIITKDNKHIDLMTKPELSSAAEIASIEHNNFCTRRLNSLIQDSDYNKSNSNNILLKIKPRFCNVNYDTKRKTTRSFYINKDSRGGGENEFAMMDDMPDMLERPDRPDRSDRPDRPDSYDMRDAKPEDANDTSSEIGIPELMKLYYDVYNPIAGDFTEMSEEMKTNVYEKDVETFYKAFTGKNIETDERGNKLITRFDQIPLREFHNDEKCKPDGLYNEQSFEGSLKDKLFKKYADHTKNMMSNMDANHDKLLTILKKLFIFKKKKEEKESPKESPTEAPADIGKEPPTELGEEPATELGPSTQQGQQIQNEQEPQTQNEQGPQTQQEQPQEQGQGPPQAQQQGPQQEQDNNYLKNQGNEPPRQPAEFVPPAAAFAPPRQPAEFAPPRQDGGEDDDEISINPDLDDDLLASLVDSTRKLIVNLYINCDADFLKGITLFESIVATQLAQTKSSRIRLLNDEINGIVKNNL